MPTDHLSPIGIEARRRAVQSLIALPRLAQAWLSNTTNVLNALQRSKIELIYTELWPKTTNQITTLSRLVNDCYVTAMKLLTSLNMLTNSSPYLTTSTEPTKIIIIGI